MDLAPSKHRTCHVRNPGCLSVFTLLAALAGRADAGKLRLADGGLPPSGVDLLVASASPRTFARDAALVFVAAGAGLTIGAAYYRNEHRAAQLAA